MSQQQSFGSVGLPGASNIEFVQGNTGLPVGPNPATFTINILGDTPQGVSVNGNPGTYTETITVADATTSTKGVASFNPSNFTVVGGVVSASGSSIGTWQAVTSATNVNSIASGNGYIAKGAGSVQFILPATASLGDMFAIVGYGNLWTLTQNAGQQIFSGMSSTTIGVAGSLTATNAKDVVYIICVTANLEFEVVSVIGNLTIV